MQFSEEDLRKALKRKDPGPEFTERVMARVKQKDSASQGATRPKLSWFPALRFSPALIAASMAFVLLLGAWIGYRSYRHYQKQAAVEEMRRQAEEQKAEQQAMLALRIASEKLNHVFRKVNGEPVPEDKIRRQRL
jgi:hypothetical protein